MRALPLLILMEALVMTAPAASAAALAPEVLGAAEAAAAKSLGKRVWLAPKQAKTDRKWTFLIAEMHGSAGAPFDFRGTRLQGAAAEGMVSRDYVVLLKRDEGGWHVAAEAIGPTDVAWEEWSTRYGAPTSLFK